MTAELRAAGCVFAEEEARLLLDAAAPGELAALVRRRALGEPLEQVVGWAEFCGLRIAVEPGVFVPRRRTEFLVHRAAALAAPGAVVADLCCGTGALGLALHTLLRRAGRPAAALHAADIDPAAVRCARRNLAPAGGEVHQGDLYAALPGALRGRIGVLLANVPYVPTSQIALLPPEAREHEPHAALDGGEDGLDVLRRVAAGAAEWLAPGGHLLVETTKRQLPAAEAALAAAGLRPHHTTSDEATALTATTP
ncbi:putative protein N(5)-glutamine methyltransferase [Streptomyces hoynatensis]|uniref:peptide chain release factor N(5)-glutamine methyltransferase n=1 Tax=Streptomyces hoynatensis TaxID=1141874 RepID=A0A3A9Z0F6_9ACTN|nr:putative protein N(5)-glutamine methyltransferase [Streptomyces hoynatensis]RKN41695.1 putative protein N(5)-glutamine methyltransferase [Streptomyces hoynatensis]